MTRDEVIELIYEELSADSTNERANRIIDAADSLIYDLHEENEHIRQTHVHIDTVKCLLEGGVRCECRADACCVKEAIQRCLEVGKQSN